MVYGHLVDWWIREEDYWVFHILWSLFAAIGAGGFLFVSGVVTALSYRSRQTNSTKSTKFHTKMMRNAYLFRALLLLLIAFIYNVFIAIAINDLTWIWAWFVLQTIGFSLLMAWPFLNTSKVFRVFFASSCLIMNFVLLDLLLPYQGQANIYGVIFHILFNPVNLYPILAFFSIFIFGTVIGEILFNVNLIKNQDERILNFKKKFINPILILGIILVIFGVMFYFPSFFQYPSFSAMVYALGINFILISVLIGVEELKIFKLEKIYSFFFYYSYYSFTIFLAHNLLFFLFYRQLNANNILFVIIATMIFVTWFLRIIYIKLGYKASIKYGIGIISLSLAKKIEQRKSRSLYHEINNIG